MKVGALEGVVVVLTLPERGARSADAAKLGGLDQLKTLGADGAGETDGFLEVAGGYRLGAHRFQIFQRGVMQTP